MIKLTVTENITDLEVSPKVTILELSSAIAVLKILTSTPDTADGIKVTLIAAENLTFGDLCYPDAAGKWAKGSATSAATSRIFVMATATIAADTEGEFLLIGFVRDDTWTWTPGNEVYLSETAGGLTQTAPTAPNSVTQLIGTAYFANRVYFNPSLDILVHI